MKKTTVFKHIVLRNIVLGLESQESEDGRIKGLKVSFKPVDEDMIYHKTTGQPIPFLPSDLGINLDMRSLIELNELFLETQSSYLFNIRKKVFDKDLIETIKSRDDENTLIKVRVSRLFFREEEKGRFKISIAVLGKNKENGEFEEIVNINFTKRDVLIFSSLIRKITASYHRGSYVQASVEKVNIETKEVIDTNIISVSKVDNSLLVDNVWLHGQELLNIMHAVERLSFKLHIEKNLDFINSIYRQIKIINKDDIAYFQLRKFGDEHREEGLVNENGERYEIRIPISGDLLSYLYLFLDINVLRHADYTTDQNVEILGSSKAITDRKIRFHISMKESTIGVGIKDKTKASAADGSKISLVGKTKEGKYSVINEEDDILENYIKVFNKDGEAKIVPVLTNFDIDLKDQYPKLISALAMSLTQEYKTEEKDWSLLRFYVINQNMEGKFKYSFTIFADSKNKAPAVLIIDKYKLKKGEDELYLGRYRQPLFEKYAYQLLSIMMTASEDIETLDLLEDQEAKKMLKYHYQSLKKIDKTKKKRKVEYGIKKRFDSVEIGNFTQKGLTSLLSYQDIELLNMTSYFRLTTGSWIPFVGERIAVGQDGYLTDMYGEVNMEEDSRGPIWAIKLFFSTSF